jgi:ABC-type lipoprotein export system ATPase subunit
MIQPVLSFVGVCKGFYRGPVRAEVLRDVELTLAPGDFVAVWGGLKSGKSTLLRIAAGFETPDEGAVFFNGEDLAQMTKRRHARLLRHELAMARRDGPPERELTTLDWVAFPLGGTMRQRAAERRAMAALQELGVDSDCRGLRWEDLTDGERTLVSIAHAIVRDPKVLLVDDPTSSLGHHERQRTIALLYRLAAERRMAVLMTAPDMDATVGAHEAFTLTSGRLHRIAPEDDGGRLLRLPGH